MIIHLYDAVGKPFLDVLKAVAVCGERIKEMVKNKKSFEGTLHPPPIKKGRVER